MATFLEQVADRMNGGSGSKSVSNVTIAGPLANVFSEALDKAYSTEIDVEEPEDAERDIIQDGFSNKETGLVGESQQTSTVDNNRLLEEITEEDIKKLNKSQENTTIYTIAKSQLNEVRVQELCKRISNFSGKTYDRTIDKYYSPLYLVLIDDQYMPSWFNSAVGTVDTSATHAMMLTIDNSAREANVPVYNTFGAALKEYGRGL